MWYLDNKKWSEITREERYFSAELYFCARIKPRPLIRLLGLPVQKAYEVAFEMCLYRDLLFHMKNNVDDKVPSVKRADLPPKRTFDLVLAANDEIIIIEAKAAQHFSKTDQENYVADKEKIDSLFKICFPRDRRKTVLRICGICSSRNRQMERDRKFFTSLDGLLITWKEVAAAYPESKAIFERANDVHR